MSEEVTRTAHMHCHRRLERKGTKWSNSIVTGHASDHHVWKEKAVLYVRHATSGVNDWHTLFIQGEARQEGWEKKEERRKNNLESGIALLGKQEARSK